MRASDGFNPLPVALAAAAVVVATIAWAGAAGAPVDLAGRWVLLGVVAGFGAWAGWIDARSHRIPDAVTLPMGAAAVAAAVVCTVISGDWMTAGQAVLGSVSLGGLYFLAALLGNLGLGDVKLAAVLGLALAYSGWTVLLWGSFLGMALALPHGLLTRKSGRHIPLGPYMAAGAVTAMVLGLARGAEFGF